MSPIIEPSELADVAPGVRLGRYEVLLGVAQGGMARVWAAKQQGQRGFTKVVAVKTILPALASDPQFEAMFLEEARIAAGVHHPNVCEIFDLGEENGILYLALEWVLGDSLARIIKPAPLPGERSPGALRLNARIGARIIADACAGLHAAHELCDDSGNRLDVVHRDVSPQNILVSLDGNVKVTDFGVVKALGGSERPSFAGQLKGKISYMAPEQAAGGRLDRRTDVFALGIVLYEITTGVRPFAAESQQATLERVRDCRFEPPSAALPGYPRELEGIVTRAMKKDPLHRYPTADRLRVALEEWLARSGSVVTQTQVGTLVRERVGAAVEERQVKIRELMRAAGGGGPPSRPDFVAPGDVSSSVISQPTLGGAVSFAASTTPSVPPPERHGALPAPGGMLRTLSLGVGIGLAAFVLILGLVVAGWLFVRRSALPVAAAVASSQTNSTARVSARSSSIRLRAVVPRSGVSYEIDGTKLPDGTESVARPAPGVVELLTLRAPGYEKDVIRLDEQSPDVLDIILAPEPRARAAAPPLIEKAVPRDSEVRTLSEDRPARAPEKRAKPLKVDIPDNPF